MLNRAIHSRNRKGWPKNYLEAYLLSVLPHLQILPSLPYSVTLELDHINIFPLPTGTMLGFVNSTGVTSQNYCGRHFWMPCVHFYYDHWSLVTRDQFLLCLCPHVNNINKNIIFTLSFTFAATRGQC